VVRPTLATRQILPTERSVVATQVARCPKFAARRLEAVPGWTWALAGTEQRTRLLARPINTSLLRSPGV
jgi:hypothetical protein